MSSKFPRTTRTVALQSSVGARLTLLSAVVLFGAWGYWFTRASVPVYEASDHARVEVLRATHPVDAPAAGRVIAQNLVLDKTVNEGDVLLELDSEPERLELAQAKAKVVGIGPQIEATRTQIAAEQHALEVYRKETASTLAVAESQLAEGKVMTRAGLVEADRSKRLFAAGIISQSDLSRTLAEAERRAAVETSLGATVESNRRVAGTGEADRESRVATLSADASRFDAELVSLSATVHSLEEAIARRTIRAPASGRLGEIGNVRIGSVVASGEHVATIVGAGDLRVVATFSPASALGRVRKGQRARVRLDGFPWTEFGQVDTVVTEVASELRDGQVRVELEVDSTKPSRIPLQHGLPGVAEVTVEEVSPATLVLRAAGRLGSREAAPLAREAAPLESAAR